MNQEFCPQCGKRSLRYRKRTKDYSCQKCPFEGDDQRIAALGTPEEREAKLDEILNSIPIEEHDGRFHEFFGELSERPLAEMEPAFEAYVASRETDPKPENGRQAPTAPEKPRGGLSGAQAAGFAVAIVLVLAALGAAILVLMRS